MNSSIVSKVLFWNLVLVTFLVDHSSSLSSLSSSPSSLFVAGWSIPIPGRKAFRKRMEQRKAVAIEMDDNGQRRNGKSSPFFNNNNNGQRGGGGGDVYDVDEIQFNYVAPAMAVHLPTTSTTNRRPLSHQQQQQQRQQHQRQDVSKGNPRLVDLPKHSLPKEVIQRKVRMLDMEMIFGRIAMLASLLLLGGELVTGLSVTDQMNGFFL